MEPNKLFFNTTVYFEKRGCFYTLFSKLLKKHEFKFIRFEIIYDDILILCNSKSRGQAVRQKYLKKFHPRRVSKLKVFTANLRLIPGLIHFFELKSMV